MPRTGSTTTTIAAGFACAVLVFALARQAAADSAPLWTAAELTERSQVVLTGRVTDLAAGWDAGTIYTYVSLDVGQVLKGWLPERQVIVKQLGGRVGDRALVVHGQAVFAKGDEVLLFLEVRPRDRSLAVTALWQGRWTIGADPVSREPFASRARPGAGPGAALGNGRDVLTSRALSALAAPATSSERSSIINVRPVDAGSAAAIDPVEAFNVFTPAWRRERASGIPVGIDVRQSRAAQRAISGGDVYSIARGVARDAGLALAAGGSGAPVCFRQPDRAGGIVVAFDDSCGELSPTGGTLAVSAVWVNTASRSQPDDDAFLQILHATVVHNEPVAGSYVKHPFCFETIERHELAFAMGGAGWTAGESALDRSCTAAHPAVVAPITNDPGGLLGTGRRAQLDAVLAPTTRVSIAPAGAEANRQSTSPSISADGRYVAFLSSATNLVAGDTNAADDVFVFDRATGAWTRDSVASDGAQANAGSSTPIISRDGRSLVFLSDASNLTVEGQRGVFYRDRDSGRITLVSLLPDGSVSSGSANAAPAASGTLRFVAFVGSTPGFSGRTSIYVRDTQTNQTTLEATAGPSSAESVGQPAISADGRYLAYVAFNGASGTVYVRDRQTAQVAVESVGSSGAPFSGSCGSPALSADGRFLMFRRETSSTPAVLVEVYVRDRIASTTTGVVGAGSSNFNHSASVSPNGRFLAYDLQPQVYRRDLTTGQSVLISDGINASAGNGDSGTLITNGAPALSVADDGTVAFESAASNLVAGDSGSVNDVFAGSGSLPGAPGPLAYTISGSNVSLTWGPTTTGGRRVAYFIDAGSSPGASDLASLLVGNLETSYLAGAVVPGTYFVRIRAVNDAGSGPSSNEVIVTLAGGAAPGAPGSLGFSVSGSTVALTWTAPATGGAATGYQIEAGSSSGAANLAIVSTGSATPSYTATNVAAGSYFVRVRGANAAGLGPPSNEAVIVVQSGPARCAAPPDAPSLAGVVDGSPVVLTWQPRGEASISFLVEAGSARGGSDLASYETENAATSLLVTRVGSGTYFVRVRGRNACGLGPPSADVVLTVS